MYIVNHHGKVQTVRELHLCAECCRMIMLNDESYIIFKYEGFTLYRHYECPPNTLWSDPPQLE